MGAIVALLAAALTVYPLSVTSTHFIVYVPLAAGGIAGLIAATGRRSWSYVSAGALIVAYLLALVLSEKVLDLVAPFYGAGAYLLVEATETAAATRLGSAVGSEVTTARLLFVLAVVSLGVMTGLIAMWAGGAARVSGPLALSLSVAAALGALSVIIATAGRGLGTGSRES